MFKLKESKKLNRKILVNEDKETYKIIRVKDKENLKTLYDDKSLVIEAVDIADENINRILDALKNEKIIAKDVIVNIFVIKGTFLNNLFDIENRLKYAPNTNIISIMLSDLENISKLMQSQLRYTLGVKWMDNLLDSLANGKSVEEILGEEPIDEVQSDIDNVKKENTTNNIDVDVDDSDEFKDIEKYVIYTNNETYPVIKKDGKYLIARQHSKDFSEDWELVGILPIGAALSRVIKPEDAIANITDWKFKNGNPKYTIVDKDHGTKRIWGGASNGVRRGINSFAKADDHTFEMITENKNKTELDTMLEKLNSKGIKLRDLI